MAISRYKYLCSCFFRNSFCGAHAVSLLQEERRQVRRGPPTTKRGAACACVCPFVLRVLLASTRVRAVGGLQEPASGRTMPKDNTGASFAELRRASLEWLREHPGTVQTILDERDSCTADEVREWEARHGQYLPDDVKEFYFLTNGLSIKWDVVAHGREVMPLGHVAINSLQQLLPTDHSVLRNERDELRPELQECAAASGLRAFTLDHTCETGRVLLLLGKEGPNAFRRAQVWFQDGSCALSLLANTFSEYFRLLALHLGLPGWQYAYTEAGLDPTCRQWFRLIAPDRLAPSLSAAPPCGSSSGGGSSGGGGGSSISGFGGGASAASALLGHGWGGGACVPPGGKVMLPVRTRWVERREAPSHAEALSLLSLASLQQQHGSGAAAGGSSRPSSAAGAPRAAVALLSGGGGPGGGGASGGGSRSHSCSRNSSATSTSSSSAASGGSSNYVSGGGGLDRRYASSGGGLRGAADAVRARKGSAARVRKLRPTGHERDAGEE